MEHNQAEENHDRATCPGCIEVQEEFRIYSNEIIALTPPIESNTGILAYCAIGQTGEAGEVLSAVENMATSVFHPLWDSNDYSGSVVKEYEHITEELGDVLWHIFRAALVLDGDSQEKREVYERVRGQFIYAAQLPPIAPAHVLANELLAVTAEFANQVKKIAYFAYPMEPEALYESILAAASLVGGISRAMHIAPSKIIETNRAKLAKRYPQGKFTYGDAMARADKKAVYKRPGVQN